jgi:uncharacterized protein YggE
MRFWLSFSPNSKLAWGFATLVFAGAPLAAQEHPAITAQPNTVFVGADGRYEANPDTAVIELAISTQEDTSSAAYARASKAAEEVRQVLRANGVDPKLAEIGYFALQPVYDDRTPKRKLIGYRVVSNVVLKLKQFERIGPIVDQLVKADVTENQQLSYTLEDKDAAKSKAVEDAYRRARASAESLAQAGGRTVGELIYASVDTVENIVPIRPLAMAAPRATASEAPAPTAEFSPQTVSISAHVNAVFQLK